jgi:phosphoribosyl 1,2-cyclic phosphodiesterase
MMADVSNLRIHFYGTQGSGSVFPDRKERRSQRKLMEFKLLQSVFEDLKRHADPETQKIQCSVEEILGGPISRPILEAYRQRFVLPEVRSYGGWTTCIWIETADGFDIVIDCGSGFRNCAKDLQLKWNDREQRDLFILGTHSHLDHTEGFDQAAVCFDPRNTLKIYGNIQFLKALDNHLGVFSRYIDKRVRGIHTPISFDLMPSKFEACEIVDLELNPVPSTNSLSVKLHHLNEPICLGKTSIRPFEVFHPAPCLAFRIERNGKTFIFCTDHELRHGTDPDHPRQRASEEAEQRLMKYSEGADVLYRDGQFLRSEYDGIKGIGNSAAVSRMDWGHSCIEDVQKMAKLCGVKKTYIGHHDPNRDWSERNWIDEALRRDSQSANHHIELACAEDVIDL